MWDKRMQTGRLRKRFDDCFVGLTFPRAPVTHLIIIHYFESPATTFGLVKATRLTAKLDYDGLNGYRFLPLLMRAMKKLYRFFKPVQPNGDIKSTSITFCCVFLI